VASSREPARILKPGHGSNNDKKWLLYNRKESAQRLNNIVAMHGYKEFFEDVKTAFLGLVNIENANLKNFTDGDFGNYAVEIIFEKSKILLDLDRMNLQVNFVNLRDSKRYNVEDVLQVLYPELKLKHSAKSKPQTRQYIIEHLILTEYLIEKYLLNVVKGDFEWSEQYVYFKKKQAGMVRRVMQLDYKDPIFQKFFNGDKTWEQDLLDRDP